MNPSDERKPVRAIFLKMFSHLRKKEEKAFLSKYLKTRKTHSATAQARQLVDCKYDQNE
jgi:hypothetical protein